jgi:hypothetical protein
VEPGVEDHEPGARGGRDQRRRPQAVAPNSQHGGPRADREQRPGEERGQSERDGARDRPGRPRRGHERDRGGDAEGHEQPVGRGHPEHRRAGGEREQQRGDAARPLVEQAPAEDVEQRRGQQPGGDAERGEGPGRGDPEPVHDQQQARGMARGVDRQRRDDLRPAVEEEGTP